MSLLKKDKTSAAEKPAKLHNKGALKQGGFAIAFTAIVIAIAVAVNLLMGFLAERVNLDLDISAQGSNTLSEENIAYLEKLEDDVVITVCTPKEEYVDYISYVAESYYSVTDEDGETSALDYFEQSINLLGLYDKYSDHITVKYIDPYSTAFNDVKTNYSNADIGDIIVECVKVIDQEESRKGKLLSFDDIYYLEEASSYYSYFGYSSYYVTGNTLESAVTSAIYKVTSDETQTALILENHCKTDNLEEYSDYLEQNNFDVEVFDDTLLGSIDPEYDLLLIAEPVEDFTVEELDVIADWLYNEGLRDKGVLFFASIDSPDTPNLDAFLEEWGIVVEDGVQWETSASYYYNNDNTLMFYTPSTELADSSDTVIQEYEDALDTTSYVISGENAPLSTLFDEENGYLVTPLFTTFQDTAVVAPLDRESGWEPDGSMEQNQHYGVVASSNSDYTDNVLHTSYVVVFASRDFVNPSWFSVNEVNTEMLLGIAQMASNAEDTGISFRLRTIDSNYFDVPATTAQIRVMTVVFEIALPLLLIGTGIFIFIRRRRR